LPTFANLVVNGYDTRIAVIFVIESLVDTLVKEDDLLGAACSLLVQLTRFVAGAGWTDW